MEVTVVVIGIFLVIGLCATIDILHPIIKKQEELEGRILYYLVFFCIASLIAPMLLTIILNAERGEQFRGYLEQAIFND